jgi:hypothetical protein
MAVFLLSTITLRRPLGFDGLDSVRCKRYRFDSFPSMLAVQLAPPSGTDWTPWPYVKKNAGPRALSPYFKVSNKARAATWQNGG